MTALPKQHTSDVRSEGSTCVPASQSETIWEALICKDDHPEWQHLPPALRSEDAEVMLKSMQGALRKLAYRKAGARLLVRLLETSTDHAGVVADEFLGVAATVAAHRFGHRVIQAIIQRQTDAASSDITVRVLLDELLLDVAYLITDKFGRRVICALLEFGSTSDQHAVLEALSEDLVLHALDRHGSHIVALALEQCKDNRQEALCQELLDLHVFMLADSAAGCRVITSLLQHCCAPDARAELLSQLMVAEEPLFATRHGRRLVKELDHFDLDALDF
jgi:hypothetical protein